MSVKVRFAPSPTGPLHVGGLRTALFNYLFAKHNKGIFILRIEDTDQARYVPGAEEYIIESLQWCGIDVDFGPHKPGADAPYRQSERKEIYKDFALALIEKGHAYYAFDTPEELEEMRKKMEASGVKAPQYNAITREYMQNSLKLSKDEVQKRLESGEPYVIRVKMPRKEDIRFEDIVRGWVTVNSSQMDDKVLMKSDGMPTYHLANVVDDHLMKITHVIRGEEWLPSAPLHVMLYRFFEWEMPKFAHLPLLLSPDGNGKLSKRDGDKYGFPIFPLEWKDPTTGNISSGYRESGYLPEAFVNFLALLGWNPGDNTELMTINDLVERFTLERVGKSGVKYDKLKSIWFNQHYIKSKPDLELLSLLKKYILDHGYSQPDDNYILQVIHHLKDRVEYITDFIKMGSYFFEAPKNYDFEVIKKKWFPEGIEFLAQLRLFLLDFKNWDATSLEESIKSFATEKNVNIGKVMPMLRFIITGTNFGPGIFDIMALIGKERCMASLALAEGWKEINV